MDEKRSFKDRHPYILSGILTALILLLCALAISSCSRCSDTSPTIDVSRPKVESSGLEVTRESTATVVADKEAEKTTTKDTDGKAKKAAAAESKKTVSGDPGDSTTAKIPVYEKVPIYGNGAPIYGNGNPIYGNGAPIYESRPIYTWVNTIYCNTCGANITGNIEGHIVPLKHGGYWVDSNQVITGYEQVIVGYEKVITGYEKVIVGYEKVIVGYKDVLIGYK